VTEWGRASGAEIAVIYRDGGAARLDRHDRIEFSITGANLLHDRHLETAPIASALQLRPVGVPIGRSVFLDTRLKFQGPV
jgi:hypothetical protein